MSVYIKKAISVLLILLMSVTMFSCSAKQKLYSREYFEYFDTIITVKAYCDSQKKFDTLLEGFEDKLKYYHRLFDIYNTYEGLNNIKTVNDNAGVKAVTVPKELTELLLLSKEWYTKTEGAFNIAFGSVIKLWEKAINDADSELNGQKPTDEALEKAAKHTDINAIIIDADNNTVEISDEELSISLGAVAKGYTVDRLYDYIDSGDITENFLINAGGNVKCKGSPPEKTSWSVGVQNPNDNENRYIDIIELNGQAVATSGDYLRYFIYNGVKYHHIIDTKTLYPSSNALSVTVKNDSAAVADILSTAFFVMPNTEAMSLAEKSGIKCYIVNNAGVLVTD